MECQLEYIIFPNIGEIELEAVNNATLKKTIGPPSKDW